MPLADLGILPTTVSLLQNHDVFELFPQAIVSLNVGPMGHVVLA